MTYNPDTHHRHSIRLKDYDYSQAGAYFVTICSWQRECLFGGIVDGDMVLNDVGRVVADEWEKTPSIRSNVELDACAIMPNHFHGILFINDTVAPKTVGAHRRAPCWDRRDGGCYIETETNIKTRAHVGAITTRAHIGAPLRRQSGSIGSIVAGFKSATTKRINIIRANPGGPVWQKNYYERVIRDENELTRAREYIVNNPMQWELDKENPVNNLPTGMDLCGM